MRWWLRNKAENSFQEFPTREAAEAWYAQRAPFLGTTAHVLLAAQLEPGGPVMAVARGAVISMMPAPGSNAHSIPPTIHWTPTRCDRCFERHNLHAGPRFKCPYAPTYYFAELYGMQPPLEGGSE
jgi:hypothetical protein